MKLLIVFLILFTLAIVWTVTRPARPAIDTEPSGDAGISLSI